MPARASDIFFLIIDGYVCIVAIYSKNSKCLPICFGVDYHCPFMKLLGRRKLTICYIKKIIGNGIIERDKDLIWDIVSH